METIYWFWRLDFHIWLHRKELFEDTPEALKVSDKYVFIRNRSLEHIAPQTPQSNSAIQWKEDEKDLMNSFGNLVMISQGLNSALQNQSYEVKRAHVEAYCNESKTGSIESLKLLIIYNKYGSNWGEVNIKAHGEEMYKLLKESFDPA